MGFGFFLGCFAAEVSHFVAQFLVTVAHELPNHMEEGRMRRMDAFMARSPKTGQLRPMGSFRVIPKEPTQAMIESMVESCGITKKQAILAHKALMASAPDVFAPALSDRTVEFSKREANFHAQQPGNTVSALDHFSMAIQRASMFRLMVHVVDTRPHLFYSETFGEPTHPHDAPTLDPENTPRKRASLTLVK